jgi:NAD-dependent deacetylase
LPRCDDCGGLLRPAVVWFGEPLAPEIWTAAESAVRAADLLLVVGTSALVYPAAGLIGSARSRGHAVIEINVESTPASEWVDLSLFGRAGEILPRLVRAIPGPGPEPADLDV